VEQAAVGAGADLVNDIGLQVAVNRTGNIFALAYVMVVAPSELESLASYRGLKILGSWQNIPVSEKKVLKPWSGS
jgi:hypothetical protein